MPAKMDENYLHWRCESLDLPHSDLAMTCMGSLTDINGHAVLLFGPYTFHVRQRLILDGDRPLSLGGRALDILQLLVERAGEVVSKDELIARVWPGTVVEAINLRVHIAAWRRAFKSRYCHMHEKELTSGYARATNSRKKEQRVGSERKSVV